MHMRPDNIKITFITLCVSLRFAMMNCHGTDTVAWQQLGGTNFDHWTGLQVLPAESNSQARLVVPGDATFRYPDGTLGFYKHGFRTMNDGTGDWKAFYGIQAEIRLDGNRELELTFGMKPAGWNGETEAGMKSVVRIHGQGSHTVTVPWTAFGFDQARTSFLKFIKELTLSARFMDGNSPGQITLYYVRVVKAPSVALECPVRGKSAPNGQTVEYQVLVTNCTGQPQSVALSFVRYGWEVMDASIEPAALKLEPGESQTCKLSVKAPSQVPPGGHEQQVLKAVANGDGGKASTLTFITASELPHPYVMHTRERWNEVKEKVKNFPWAKALQDDFVKRAGTWTVPEVTKPPHNDPDDTMGPFLFSTTNENGLMASGIAWQLTGDKSYAEKAALFLRRLSNPEDGYPKTLRCCNQSLVQEGGFFQHIAMAYDMILDSGVLTDGDRRQIEQTLRVFLESMERANDGASINNWNLSEVTGAFYCGLAMQDLVTAQRFFSGPGGICDQLSKGTMDDGWWYECTISYNMWCASEFTQAALAWQPWGVNFKDMWLPASYSPHVMLVSELNGGGASRDSDPEARRKPFGMNADVFGPTCRPYRQIRDLWNGLLPFLDYRGIMFGVNDSTENKVAGYRTEVVGQPFEIAYYVYRDPAYASIIKRGGGTRDLLYGVPELPEKMPEQFRDSAYADNVGLVMLRSQTENRPISDQIQAVLHYGTHGWAHGHFDRTDLLSLIRFGRSFWNPESVFWVYEPFMYKFYCQTSENHNMVVVDQKMQEATPGERLLFHTGKMMQATAVETTARWSRPPYGGMVYDYVPVKTFAEKCWREGRSVPIPKNPPEYGSLTGYTEPVLQRRLMAVTDDYVVLADYVKGAEQHTFDSLFQLKGFQGLDAPGKKFLRHDAQWNPDPLGSAQFVTDCDWYSVEAPAVGRFEERWGPGVDEEGSRSIGNEPGVLKLDVHSLWPRSQEIMVATAPEMHPVEKRLYYSVRGDGKTLADGKFGAWILGQAEIDAPVEGVSQLELETKVELSKKPTLFWANARVVTRSGHEIPISHFPVNYENVEQPKEPGKDYFGGPIKIVGMEYKSAVPGQPHDDKQPGLVRVDLSGKDAVRFKATLGGDYPLGDESRLRKVYAIRSQGGDARYLTIIEPYEAKPVIKSAEAISADKLRVELVDGRVQEIQIRGLEGDGKGIGVSISESRDGKVIRSDTTQP
jgi:hypothetical protein